jgi:hypothetical protein
MLQSRLKRGKIINIFRWYLNYKCRNKSKGAEKATSTNTRQVTQYFEWGIVLKNI